MAYRDFTFSKVKEAFQLTIDEKTNLFANTAKIQPSQILTTLLQENLSFAIAVGTEKARSEFSPLKSLTNSIITKSQLFMEQLPVAQTGDL